MIDTIPNFEIPVKEFVLTKEMLESGKNVYIPEGVKITDEALVYAVEKGFVKPNKEQVKLIENYNKKYELSYILEKLGLDEKQVKILFEKYK